jgi:lysyl-tRNA synthetase class 2
MNIQRMKQKRELVNIIRSFFEKQNFFELETPLLVPSPGMEVHLHGFETHYVDHSGKKQAYYLPTSPEFALKKALGSGFDKVFEIARVFRNHGELGPQHHPEFNMLEWYRPGDYVAIMDDVESLLTYISHHFSHIPLAEGDYWEKSIKRTSIQSCFQEYAGMELATGMSDLDLWRRQAAAALKEIIPVDDSFEDIFFRVWMKLIEPKLGRTRPEIVYDYPASMSALAKLKSPENVWAERFELYIRGVEIGNAFSELIDPVEQRTRFELANNEREKLGYQPHPIDEELIRRLKDMKPTGGIAIGIERLLMVLTLETDIRQCFIYPVGEANLR